MRLPRTKSTAGGLLPSSREWTGTAYDVWYPSPMSDVCRAHAVVIRADGIKVIQPAIRDGINGLGSYDHQDA